MCPEPDPPGVPPPPTKPEVKGIISYISYPFRYVKYVSALLKWNKKNG